MTVLSTDFIDYKMIFVKPQHQRKKSTKIFFYEKSRGFYIGCQRNIKGFYGTTPSKFQRLECSENKLRTPYLQIDYALDPLVNLFLKIWQRGPT